ncbi:hypothetical protein CIL03_12030 [Virgibacillus indicus]|uniref:SH3b domain-containing protein n=2 Tax=Virgibacillus indicus TaxID=2024554 RepID=A0A265NAM6_9BACI|nr:hypothetical protein CIL03_12030 [Virgibacillus indicus]
MTFSSKTSKVATNNQVAYYGVALQNPTHIYASQSVQSSNILKSYEQGSILKYYKLNDSWYETGVYINGNYHIGYIHKSHVENTIQNPEWLNGVALKSSTPVYTKASTSSKALKSYPTGSILKYSTFSNNWYQTGVYINGVKKTGYIHKFHVENAIQNPVWLDGVALKSPTSVYTDASTSSKALKSYPTGSILKYSTFSNNWYQTGVYINGVKKTGYIHKSHVENAIQNPEWLNGVALKSPTSVYTDASTSSKALKSYPTGSILTYSTFSNNWYETGVYINGVKKTGYIHKSHVENAIQNPEWLNGVALKSPTSVYTDASISSKALKSYPTGSILTYSTFSNNWYETGVYINGVKKTGYIHKSHAETITDNQKSLSGYGIKNPTKVYSLASKQSKPLKVYNYGSKLKFKTFTKNWYEATVYINGQKHTGYIHTKDITFEDIAVKTNYNLTLADALEIQKTANPQTTNEYNTFVSKDWINNNKVTADVLNVRGGPSTSYWVVGQLTKGQHVTVLNESGGWYQIEYTKKHQFVNASPDDVLQYLNPNNFVNDKRQQFQFLDLSRNSAATASVLNKYLQGKGTLSGQGKAFIDAGNTHGISDVYLISHAILETGNGSSTLATGVNYRGVTVYNMFGIGAYDSCPIDCGAKKAYEEGWTTPYKAIVGGAGFIGNSYIKSGLNTLYKMRWNPQAMDLTGAYGKQYATDIGWASKQVNSMYNLYQQLDSYVLFLDIPVYRR